ncbi:MAG: twin-arginine translocase subunit TatC [Caldisericaceae bacterium]|nr:twin-arginine translocase subunit TatC [Caldisericaceae bacterium]
MKRKKIEEVEMPFLDHLEELRWRIIKSLIAVVIFTIISFAFSDQILDFLLLTTKNLKHQLQLQVLKVQTVFIIKLELALIAGIMLSLPVIFYQIWAFVAPGLLENERKYVVPVITFATISFIVGAAFAFFVIIPFALDFFLSLVPENVKNNIALDFYFGFVARIVLVFGIVFELPVVSLLLTKLGLLTPQFLRKYRRYAIVVIFVLAAILTPPDPTTQIMLAVPLLLLFEVSIWISYFFAKKPKKE